MNIITNILFSIYLYFLFKLDNASFYIIVLGIVFPHFEFLLTLFIKDRLKISNKIFHSIPIITLFNLIISFLLIIVFKELNYLHSFLFLFLGNLIHLFSDLLKSKPIYIVYPFRKNRFSLSISNYFDLAPIIILVISNFLIIFLGLQKIRVEVFLPLLLLIIYFNLRFLIKKIIFKKLYLI